MQKKYNLETLQMVWDMFHKEFMTTKDVAEELNTSLLAVNEMYQASLRRIGPPPRRNDHVNHYHADKPKKIERPRAEYSNSSPYRIAMPGIKN